MLLHVFISTDVEEACVLDVLWLPETVTWKAGRLRRAGRQRVLWYRAVSKLGTTSSSRNVQVLLQSTWSLAPYKNLL